jgi:hypothetical protein
MPELGTSGSVGAAGGQPPAATRPLDLAAPKVVDNYPEVQLGTVAVRDAVAPWWAQRNSMSTTAHGAPQARQGAAWDVRQTACSSAADLSGTVARHVDTASVP